jgi:hypothetical protein
MEEKLEKYYNDRFSMMGEQGWVDLMEDVDLMIKSTNSLDGVETVEKLQFKKGELNILNWLKSIREVSIKSYDDIKAQDESS